LYDTVVNPSEFDAFPFGANVPANANITLHGIVGSTFSPSENDGSNDISTAYLRFTRDRKIMFDPDRNGITFWDTLATQSADQIGAGQSPIHNYSSTDLGLPLFFDPPIEFSGGVELLIHVTTQIAGSGANVLIADQEVGCILTIRRG